MASPIFDAYARSDFLGKIIFLSLGGLSILSWIIILYKLWISVNVERAAANLHQFLKKHMKAPLNIDVRPF